MGRWSVGNALGEVVPANILLGAEIRTVKKFLEAEYFDFLFCGLLDQLQVLVDHGFLDLRQRAVAAYRVACLNQTTAHVSGHRVPPREAKYYQTLRTQSRPPKVINHEGHEGTRRRITNDFLRAPSCPSWLRLYRSAEHSAAFHRLLS